jgi:hypothetical protein
MTVTVALCILTIAMCCWSTGWALDSPAWYDYVTGRIAEVRYTDDECRLYLLDLPRVPYVIIARDGTSAATCYSKYHTNNTFLFTCFEPACGKVGVVLHPEAAHFFKTAALYVMIFLLGYASKLGECLRAEADAAAALREKEAEKEPTI